MTAVLDVTISTAGTATVAGELSSRVDTGRSMTQRWIDAKRSLVLGVSELRREPRLPTGENTGYGRTRTGRSPGWTRPRSGRQNVPSNCRTNPPGGFSHSVGRARARPGYLEVITDRSASEQSPLAPRRGVFGREGLPQRLRRPEGGGQLPR